jgi:hypothetical protein
MAPSSVDDGLVCEDEDHQPNEDEQNNFRPIVDLCGPAVVLMPGSATIHFSSLSIMICDNSLRFSGRTFMRMMTRIMKMY